MSAPAPGLRLGPYEIVSLLGTGGMGQVWKATDTRLSRPVAIKFARERLSERTEKEARCIAQLNHSHICSIYDVGPDYLVMELVEGKSLRGPLPIDEVLTYAIQIADALTAAHEKGIVHRDLKPTNILIAKAGVKLLDFGAAWQKRNPEDSEETAFDATQPGIVVGTLPYMAPEQLEGKAVDARTDIFAFGALLYEAITGKRAFQFNKGTRTITPVLAGHGELASTNEPLISVALNDVVRTCLEEDPNNRWQSARELKHALMWIGVERDRSRPKSRATWVGRPQTLLTAAVLLAVFSVALWRKPGYPEPTRVDTVTYSGRDFSPAVSPDGRVVAFSSDRDGTPKIWLKQLDGGGEVALTSGPDDNPRFSPDGTSLLFARTNGVHVSLYRVSSLGGDTRKLIDDAVDGDFSFDGQHIAFVRWNRQKLGEESIIGTAQPDGSNLREIARFPNVHLNRPRWSPDGSTIAAAGSPVAQGGLSLGVWIVAADGSRPRQLKAFGLNRGMSSVDWANNRTLIYMRGDRYIPVNGQLILHDVRKDVTRQIPWSCCALTVDAIGPGRVIFDQQSTRTGLLKMGPEKGTERWISRANSCDREPVFSPDDSSVVFTSSRGGAMNLWQVRLDTGAVTRLTEDSAADQDPAFSPDGNHLIFGSDRSGAFEIYMANRDGSGARQITHDGVDAENATMTPDGQWLVYASGNPEKLGLWKVHPDGTGSTRLVNGIVSNPEVSPDGRSIAYIAASTQPDWVEIRVARVSDGSEVPFRIRCHVQKQTNITIGRVRWIAGRPNSSPDDVAFIGQDEKGATGVYIQEFLPGVDTGKTRKKLRSFDFRMPLESLGISHDGKTFMLSVADDMTSVMLASQVPGVDRVRPKGR